MLKEDDHLVHLKFVFSLVIPVHSAIGSLRFGMKERQDITYPISPRSFEISRYGGMYSI